MIRPAPGVAFTLADDGDLRSDRDAVRRVSSELGISPGWATVRQVHGAEVALARDAGDLGDADGLVTTVEGLPLAVFTADCAGIVLHGDGGVGVAHAGWRGVVAGIVEELVHAMRSCGVEPQRATIGPAIGPCCYEVGAEVRDLFPGFEATTRTGRPSIDLRGAVVARLGAVGIAEVEVTGPCTFEGPDTFSHRRRRDTARMAAIGWRST